MPRAPTVSAASCVSAPTPSPVSTASEVAGYITRLLQNCPANITNYAMFCTMMLLYIAFCDAACASSLDVVFLIDTSGSVQRENFRDVKQFAIDVISQLDIDTGNVSCGCIRTDARTDVTCLS